jgi:hypothetical protein
MGFQTPLYELAEYLKWTTGGRIQKVQYVNLAVDIHHVFPQKWCNDNGIDDERRESIVNKTPLSAATNRAIGGAAPARYLPVIERKAGIHSATLDKILASHLVDFETMRSNDFDRFFVRRRDALVELAARAMGKPVQRDVEEGIPEETPDHFDADDWAVIPDSED